MTMNLDCSAKTFDLYVCDFDGVLASSLSVKGSSFRAAFDELYSVKAGAYAEAYHFDHLGQGRTEKINSILKHLNVWSSASQIRTENAFTRHLSMRLDCIDLNIELLNFVRSASGRKIIWSAAPAVEIRQILGLHSTIFDEIIGPVQDKLKLNQWLNKNGLEGHSGLYFGDTNIDRMAAEKAGLEYFEIIFNG
jgi:phosphoglycolate phosphatase-like HAD superfamily hydrolase